ncbi:hypothetical protein DQ04_03511020 [Trypanosoma grayi]|uniref:hypothetical protein n=1 Tax=Trypanosoma grayi TaxID=71804 RepID=UPI0004F429DE|nr:hypothetical protein DQ04_03511020 [Trypanosoma grayi]KEG10610.1 hypothetical protein DQ04_03511020 [Trypanosoma grayi]
MPVSPQHRRFVQQHYLEYSERDAGVSHLWHAQRLAEMRLRAGKGITDAPDVDFRHPELMDRKQAQAGALMTRLQRRVLGDEKRIVKDNRSLYEHILNVNDAAHRERQGINNLPSKGELRKWYRKDEHMLSRLRDRKKQAADTQEGNLLLMRFLVKTQPTVESAKQLSRWYHDEHKKRVQQLSRFKRSEPFAGANVLRTECGVRLTNDKAGFVEPNTAALGPPVWRQLKVPTLMETLHTGPMLPSLQEASQRYVHGNVDTDAEDTFAASWASTPPPRPAKKPEWKNISALDVTLINYANDMMLSRGGDLPIVRREEENAVTRLWREGVEERHRVSELEECARAKWAPDVTGDAMRKGKRVLSTTVSWDANRWKSRTSVLTLLRDRRSPTSSGRRSLGSAAALAAADPSDRRCSTATWSEKKDRPHRSQPSLSIIIPEDEGDNVGPRSRDIPPVFGGEKRVYQSRADELPTTERQGYKPHSDTNQVYKPRADDDCGDELPTIERQGYKPHSDTNQTYKPRADEGQYCEVEVDVVGVPTCESYLDTRRSLADWTKELRQSSAPFAPY